MTYNQESLTKTFETAQQKLVTQASDYPLIVIKHMVENGQLMLSADYQRRDRWDVVRQSELIESFLMNVPVPPIYLAEEVYGDYSVIDGKQRLTAGVDFISNRYKLQGLKKFQDLNGLAFNDLPPTLQSAISTRPYLRFITLLKQSDSNLKYEVFTRLNRGGERLTDQEVRNAAYNGPFNELIYELANEPFLRKCLKIKNNRSPKYKDMTDAEFVLRFFTLNETWESFSGDLSGSMNRMMEKRRRASASEISDYAVTFKRAMAACEQIFGDRAFQRPVNSGKQWRDQTISGLYDAEMIAVSNMPDAKINILAGRKKNVLQGIIELVNTNKVGEEEFAGFEDSIRLQTNTPSKVRLRVSAMMALMNKVAE